MCILERRNERQQRLREHGTTMIEQIQHNPYLNTVKVICALLFVWLLILILLRLFGVFLSGADASSQYVSLLSEKHKIFDIFK